MADNSLKKLSHKRENKQGCAVRKNSPNTRGWGCECEHTGTAKALKTLALIWKHFAKGKSARSADKKNVFAVRSYLTRKILQKPQHRVFSRPNPHHTQPHTHPSAHLSCKAAHRGAPITHLQQRHLSLKYYSVSPGSPTANGVNGDGTHVVPPLCQLYPGTCCTYTSKIADSFPPQKQKQLWGTHMVQYQRTNLSSFPSFACTSEKHKYTTESLQPHEMGAGVIKHWDKHCADGFACAHRAGSPMSPPHLKKEQFAPEPTQTSALSRLIHRVKHAIPPTSFSHN